MNELFKNLDESIFTPELTSQIQELYESKINSVKAEYEAQLQESFTKLSEVTDNLEKLEAKAGEYAEYVKEEYEAKIETLKEEFEVSAEKYAEYVKETYEAENLELKENVEKYTEYVKEELTSTLSEYLNLVVEEYVEANRVAIDESIQSAKATAILEGFDAILVTAGVSLSQIVEAKEAKVDESQVATLQNTINKLVKENVALKNESSELSKSFVINTVSENLTLAQKDKFDKLVEMVVYTGDADIYKEKLSTLVETVIASPVKDDVVADKIVETVVTSSQASYKRFF